MDYFEFAEALDEFQKYRRGESAPRFPVPAVKVDFEFVYNLSQDCVALAVITHEAGDAD